MCKIVQKLLCNYFKTLKEDSKECKEAETALRNYLKRNTTKKMASDISWLAFQATYAHEKQGFVAGFRCALRLFGQYGGGAL